MTTQTEAQKLADWLDAHSNSDYSKGVEAAAELRRLDAANAELLEALISIAEDSSDEGARECAMAAIKKHGGAA